MKYRFSIIAPHPDDEFIGCRKFIQQYSTNIDNIIFVTNGEKCLTDIPDLIEYAIQRRKESIFWIKSVTTNCDIHFLNIQDGINILAENSSSDEEIFYLANKKTILRKSITKLWK